MIAEWNPDTGREHSRQWWIATSSAGTNSFFIKSISLAMRNITDPISVRVLKSCTKKDLQKMYVYVTNIFV